MACELKTNLLSSKISYNRNSSLSERLFIAPQLVFDKKSNGLVKFAFMGKRSSMSSSFGWMSPLTRRIYSKHAKMHKLKILSQEANTYKSKKK
jgi:hypothetical protein